MVVAVFDRILCGIDDSSEATEAARQAAMLKAPEGSLELVAVAPRDLAVHAGWAMSRVLDEIESSARTALERAVDEVKPTASRLVAGDPADCLLRELESTSATLVAVGSHGHRRATGILLGSVAATMLHRAPCSVLLARKPTGPSSFPASILVGVDGSVESMRAADVAAGIASRFGAECVVLAASGGKRIDVEAIARQVPALVVDDGRAVEALSDAAAEADLLVLGSRGLHGLGSLGSVSERVAHRAPCSVLVVR